MQIKGTKNLKFLLNSTQPIVVLEGSARAGKSVAAIQYLIIKALETPDTCVRVFRENSVTCSKTIVIDFLEVMRSLGIFERDNWNSTLKKYSFPNKSTFYFDGCEVDKLHGLRQDYALLEEVMSINRESYNQISTRTTKQILMTYNPSVSSHWVFKSILTRDPTKVGYLHSTYKDNPFLTPVQIAAIESYDPDNPINVSQGTANEWHHRVYCLGLRCGREGRIYTDYRLTESWPTEHNFKLHGYGLDFGFSKDESALIECGILNNELWVREIIYAKNLTVAKNQSNPNLPSLVKLMEDNNITKHDLIIGDSASPESISTLQNAGYNITGVKKGPDSILNGINLVKQYRMVIFRESTHIMEELENYTWAKHNSSGEQLNKPIDGWDHALSATRYWVMHHTQYQRQEEDPNYHRPTRTSNDDYKWI